MNCLFRHIYHLISSGLRALKLVGLYIFLIGLYELLAMFVRNIFPLLVVHLKFLFWGVFSGGPMVSAPGFHCQGPEFNPWSGK